MGQKWRLVGRKLPAPCLTSDRHVARLPHSEEVAERSGLLPADLAVAKADPHRSPIDLKLHLTAVAATRSLQHEILPVRTRIYHILRAAMESHGRAVRGITRHCLPRLRQVRMSLEERDLLVVGDPHFTFASRALEAGCNHEPLPVFYKRAAAVATLKGQIKVA
jgi:hypothetical protein